MEIKISGKRYHVVFRTIVTCQIRECSNTHWFVAEGKAQCHPLDTFDPQRGKWLAFKRALDQSLYSVRDFPSKSREQRREAWTQFLCWLNGGPKKIAAIPEPKFYSPTMLAQRDELIRHPRKYNPQPQPVCSDCQEIPENVIVATPDAFDAFKAALDKPPQELPRLKRLLEEPSILESPKAEPGPFDTEDAPF